MDASGGLGKQKMKMKDGGWGRTNIGWSSKQQKCR